MEKKNAAESPGPASTTTEPPEVSPKRSRQWLKIASVVVILIVVLCSLFVFWRFWSAQPEPWLFVGAYANYRGNTTVDSTDVNATARMEIVELNSTHGKALIYLRMTFPTSPPYENQSTYWFDIQGKSLDVPGATLLSDYEEYTYFEGFGTRCCVIAKYSINDPSMSFEMMVFMDKETGWPMRFDYDYSQPVSWSLDLKIVDTNISELNP